MSTALKASRRRLLVLLGTVVAAGILVVPGALATHGVPVEVTNGSNDAFFPQNKQNEPAMAVDANHPNILVAGSNDEIDNELCNVGNDKTCPFSVGVGGSGVYFSFDSGDTWTQPTYTGWSMRHCVGVAGDQTDTCAGNPSGPIGTLPWYYENGLVSDGDPGLAFGPVPKNGTFSWSNGSRLYYSNLTSNFGAARNDAFLGYEAIAVSRTDDVEGAAAGDKSAWMPPVIASKQSGTTFSDKSQIWADNASSSPFFGTVYICYAQYRGNAAFQNANEPAPLTVAVSHDGGNTWKNNQLVPAGTSPNNNSASSFGLSGCTVRTTSNGVAYVFAERFIGNKRPSQHVMFQSFDGGKSWTKGIPTQTVVDPCDFVDPVIGRCVEDGVAGARNDLAAAPSVDIANGAPTGADATNEIVDAWADGRDGTNHEHVMVSYSTNGGGTWSSPQAIESPPDRGYYAAPALSPNGTDLYVVYNAFDTPFQPTTATPRSLVGVFKHADIGAGGAPVNWTMLHKSPPGDPRASSQNDLTAEFLGDYVYAVATRTYGAGVWNDVRNGADCPAIDAYRQMLRDGTATTSSTDPNRPAPNYQCPQGGPVAFGNTDIFGGSWADPTP
jgi:hypothetical protein